MAFGHLGLLGPIFRAKSPDCWATWTCWDCPAGKRRDWATKRQKKDIFVEGKIYRTHLESMFSSPETMRWPANFPLKPLQRGGFFYTPFDTFAGFGWTQGGCGPADCFDTFSAAGFKAYTISQM
ncbi:unnamed protein product [Durusdinium trenchii]|uniref:Uncharacterized protein n=1 Tax=Durusdinium trenchii TaxID=1381693 RepID=A0ABP0H657_9DINO